MRIFRIKARTKNNQVVNQREYVGLDKLRMYGIDVWRRYNRYATAELYEINADGKWIQIADQEEARKLLNPYARDRENHLIAP